MEETMKTVTDFIFLGFKITVNGHCSHEIIRCLLLGRNAMTNLDSVLESRDITLLTKVCIVKAMVFPVVMYWCESWTIKNAECQRIDTFELWCWRRLLRVPWTAVHPKGDQSWVFIGRTDVEAETPILGPPDGKSWLIGKDPDAGKDWGQEEKVWSTSLSTDTSGIHLQTQKCLQNTSWEQAGVPDHRKRIYRTTQNSVGWRN